MARNSISYKLSKKNVSETKPLSKTTSLNSKLKY